MTILWWTAVLFGWVSASFALFVYTEARSLLVTAVALLALVVSTGLLRPRWAPAVTVTASGVFIGLWFWLDRDTGNPATVLAAVTAAGGAFWLSRAVAARVRNVVLLTRDLRRRIVDLSIEESTGVLKLGAGRALIASEVERARRYRRPVALLRIGLAAPEEWLRVHGAGQLQVLDHALAQLLRESLRAVDRVIRFDTAEYLLMLAETGLGGAKSTAHRLAYAARERLNADVCIGIAEFPTSGQSTDDLIAEANAAVGFARSADLTVASQE